MKKKIVFLLLIIVPIISTSVSYAASQNTTDEIQEQDLKSMLDKICERGGCSVESVKQMDDEEFLLNVLQPTVKLIKLKQKYEAAKEKEQSLANRTLTAATVAATGIGGMELAMGLSEQKADKEADADMAAYMATMRCTYGNKKQVNAGPDEIELPGGNNSELMSLRNEYFSLAADLKERKEALGMAPGIESEEILDKATSGLYDDENIGTDSGAYASIYRAENGNETDQAKIDEERKVSKNRVIGGGVAAGAGVVGGTVGNAVINRDRKTRK